MPSHESVEGEGGAVSIEFNGLGGEPADPRVAGGSVSGREEVVNHPRYLALPGCSPVRAR